VAERVPEVSIDRIREHARAQVARTSLRKVAKKAGIKVGATKKFVDGSNPYERNLRLWKRWYARELREGVAGSPDDSVTTDDARGVLELLTWGLPEEERATAVGEAVEAFRQIYASRSRPPPRWASALGGGEPAPETGEEE
jgi:hypothetical protein